MLMTAAMHRQVRESWPEFTAWMLTHSLFLHSVISWKKTQLINAAKACMDYMGFIFMTQSSSPPMDQHRSDLQTSVFCLRTMPDFAQMANLTGTNSLVIRG